MCAGFVVGGPLGPCGDLWARGAVVRVLYCVLVTACRAVRPYRGRARREKVETLLLGTKPGNSSKLAKITLSRGIHGRSCRTTNSALAARAGGDTPKLT